MEQGKLSIVLEKTRVASGEYLCGEVVLAISKPCSFYGVELKMKGKEETTLHKIVEVPAQPGTVGSNYGSAAPQLGAQPVTPQIAPTPPPGSIGQAAYNSNIPQTQTRKVDVHDSHKILDHCEVLAPSEFGQFSVRLFFFFSRSTTFH